LKKIGISLRVGTIEEYNEKRDQISQEWIVLLQELDLIPILIPNNLLDVKKFIKFLELDGIILSGGDNIGDFPERDETEKSIIEMAMNYSIPTLGVCRGMQIINDFFGGSVMRKCDKEHVNNEHIIKLTNEFSFIEKKSIVVNSYHNNIIESNMLGENLITFAKHENDETVEGFTHSNYPIKGVMWHPERKQNMNSISLLKKLFLDDNL
tara:strand:+ start:1993 stop:2619 length:627 start_codon:yes stop_codon:yes gene_type:complete